MIGIMRYQIIKPISTSNNSVLFIMIAVFSLVYGLVNFKSLTAP